MEKLKKNTTEMQGWFNMWKYMNFYNFNTILE